jgi:hypothetical protein
MDISSQPKYEEVHLDDHDEAGSNTEVEDSLMGDEKKWHDGEYQRSQSPQRRKRNRCVSALWSGRWFLDTILLFAILGLLVRQQLRIPKGNKWEVGGDFTGVAPPSCKSLQGVHVVSYKY